MKKKISASNPNDDQLRQTTLLEFIEGEGATTECNNDNRTGDRNNGADGSTVSPVGLGGTRGAVDSWSADLARSGEEINKAYQKRGGAGPNMPQ